MSAKSLKNSSKTVKLFSVKSYLNRPPQQALFKDFVSFLGTLFSRKKRVSVFAFVILHQFSFLNTTKWCLKNEQDIR